MCDPVTIAIASVVGGAVLNKVMTPHPPKAQAAAAPAATPAAAIATPAEVAKDSGAQAQQTQTQATQAVAAAEAKQPDTDVLYARNKQAEQEGGTTSSTSLTGPVGVDPKTLPLSKNTLLGD